MRRIVTAGMVVLAAGALAGEAAAQGRIGAVAAVNRDMEGTPPEKQKRLLVLGDDVVSNELIETSPIGNGHLLFVDQTSLAVAPNSSIILDRYVFDPERKTGDVALSLTKGALRFIGGRITKDRAATIRTPTATIGIRGSGAIIEVSDACSGGGGASGCDTKVTVLSADEVTVSRYGDVNGDGIDDGPDGDSGTSGSGSGGGTGTTTVTTTTSEPLSTVTLSRPGATATVSAADGANYSGLASSAELAGVIASFEGSKDGGSPTVASTPAATVKQSSQTVAEVNSQSTDSSASPQQSGGAADVANDEAADTGAGLDSDFAAENLEENSLSEELQNDPESFFPGDIPSPGDLATLSGVAIYSGPAEGFVSIPDSGLEPDAISGTFSMAYDFDLDAGAIDFEILDGVFSTDVAGEIPNDPTFSGSDAIFGGPNTVSADGNFVISGGDPAGGVRGDFEIDLVTENQLATGSFGGPRDD